MAKQQIKSSSFNPLNPFDWKHLAGTVPSRVAVAYYSPYAVEAAMHNAERTKTAQERRTQINEFKALAVEAKVEGDLSAKRLKQAKRAAKARIRETVKSQLELAGY